jgi:ribosomal peptide maturation radical SAM protein 1
MLRLDRPWKGKHEGEVLSSNAAKPKQELAGIVNPYVAGEGAEMEPRVALVSMPWTTLSEPSLGLALLKAQLAAEGIESRVFHLNIQLLRYITDPAYHQFSMCWGLNEFAFSAILDAALDQAQVDCLLPRCAFHAQTTVPYPFKEASELGRAFITLRHEVVPEYLASCAVEILDWRPTIVGFTCLFDQTIPSAALASLIRERDRSVPIVFGGYSIEGPPAREVLRAFPHIDGIAEGDGEPIIGELARASTKRNCLDGIPGVLTRANLTPAPRRKFDLDSSPVPDYSDWFRDLAALKSRDRVVIRTTALPVESSRGCWWGQKQHCIFCGIDDATLSYRHKRPQTVLDLLATLRERHGADLHFRFTDYILPHVYIRDLLPKLAQVEPPYTLSCEIKANQNEERVRAFAAAGFRDLQPGIESFDSSVLRSMKKGVTGIQNVFLLKLGYLYRILINYNLLYGFPGDILESYHRMVTLLPRLYHLMPPFSRLVVAVTRFAPLYENTELFGTLTKPRHDACYDTLFSGEFLRRTGFNLDNYAYLFDRYYKFKPGLEPLYEALEHIVDHWKAQHRERDVSLSYAVNGPLVILRDSRFGSARDITLDEMHSRVYLACAGAPVTLNQLAASSGLDADPLDSAIQKLDAERIVWREDDLVVGLAIPEPVVEAHRQSGWVHHWPAIYAG